MRHLPTWLVGALVSAGACGGMGPSEGVHHHDGGGGHDVGADAAPDTGGARGRWHASPPDGGGDGDGRTDLVDGDAPADGGQDVDDASGDEADASDAMDATDAPEGDAAADAPVDAVPAVPPFGYVWVIWMENQPRSAIAGKVAAPFINGLMATHVEALDYHFVAHPSLPNYLALTSGDTHGIDCTCEPVGDACDELCTSPCACPRAVPHIGQQLDTAGITWRQYGEGMGAPCGLENDSDAHYLVRHIPFVYYDDLREDGLACADRVVDFSLFPSDLATASRRVSFISPNACNDMHDDCGGGDVAQGDAWLSFVVPAIMATPQFRDRGLLVIVWDEDESTLVEKKIPLILISPLLRAGTPTKIRYDHYSLLATLEDGLGLPRLGQAATAKAITDVWK